MIQKPEVIDGLRLRTQIIIYLSCMCMRVHVVAVYVVGYQGQVSRVQFSSSTTVSGINPGLLDLAVSAS